MLWKINIASGCLLLSTAVAQTIGGICTTTIHANARCCPPSAAVTSTVSVDCHGCALVTHLPWVCDLVCPRPAKTVSGSTTSVTVCATSYSTARTFAAPSSSATNGLLSLAIENSTPAFQGDTQTFTIPFLWADEQSVLKTVFRTVTTSNAEPTSISSGLSVEIVANAIMAGGPQKREPQNLPKRPGAARFERIRAVREP